MIESTLIQDLIQEYEVKGKHEMILAFLEGRFGQLPKPLIAELDGVLDDDKLKALAKFASTCKDLKAFRKRLKA